MICPKCGKEMAGGILGGKGGSFFLPQGEAFPRMLSHRILEKRHAVCLPPDLYSAFGAGREQWPAAFWCGGCKLLVADYARLME